MGTATKRGEWLSAIEIKTRFYLIEDLEKHKGYRESVESNRTDFVFIAVDPPVRDPGGFRFVSAGSSDIGRFPLMADHLNEALQTEGKSAD
jgi:hypothetical protein